MSAKQILLSWIDDAVRTYFEPVVRFLHMPKRRRRDTVAFICDFAAIAALVANLSTTKTQVDSTGKTTGTFDGQEVHEYLFRGNNQSTDSRLPGSADMRRSGKSPHGRVVSGDAQEGQVCPIRGASICVGEAETRTSESGQFNLALADQGQPEQMLRISHPDYVTRLFRLDDLVLAAGRDIKLVPKMRIVVADFEGVTSTSQSGIIRKGIEDTLACNHIRLLANNERDRIVDALRSGSNGHALYDEGTFSKIGSFYGATHGLFGSITATGARFELECKLISFKTYKIETRTDLRFEGEASMAQASAYLTDQLLAELTEIQILTPRNGARAGRHVSVSGYALFQPANWDLWVTIVPSGNSLYYPQQRILAKSDASWIAPAVYLGSDAIIGQSAEFNICALITAPEYSTKILDYLGKRGSPGLDINSWDKRKCRIVSSVRVNSSNFAQ